MIHRDLKPQNVMVGAFGEAVVVDWGLAKTLVNETEFPDAQPDGGASNSSSDHERPDGTEAYMCPEQTKGNADIRSDIFGLGAILYSILTGPRPYLRGRDEELAASSRESRRRGIPPPRVTRASPGAWKRFA